MDTNTETIIDMIHAAVYSYERKLGFAPDVVYLDERKYKAVLRFVNMSRFNIMGTAITSKIAGCEVKMIGTAAHNVLEVHRQEDIAKFGRDRVSESCASHIRYMPEKSLPLTSYSNSSAAPDRETTQLKVHEISATLFNLLSYQSASVCEKDFEEKKKLVAEFIREYSNIRLDKNPTERRGHEWHSALDHCFMAGGEVSWRSVDVSIAWEFWIRSKPKK